MTGYNVLALVVAACTLLLLGVSLARVGKRPRYAFEQTIAGGRRGADGGSSEDETQNAG